MSNHTQVKLLVALIAFVIFSHVARPSVEASAEIKTLTRNIPGRANDDLTGSQFAQYVLKMNAQQREEAIRDEVLKGNVPTFLRQLAPVELGTNLPDGRRLIATIFVAPDYLAIGSDEDFLRIPMNLHTAVLIADRFGFILPTKKMVDAIYVQSSVHFVPQPLPAGPQMRSTEYYWTHNQMIEEQARFLGVRPGELVSGHKKDVVITNLLASKVGRIAIYGWHRGPGEPIQPLSIVHGANYADYSHGIRLVSEMTLIDGKLRSVSDVLQDPSLARIFSDEGPIRNISEILSLPRDPTTPLMAASN